MYKRSRDRYDDRFANLCKVSSRSLADCISMELTSQQLNMAEWTEDDCRKLIENVKAEELRQTWSARPRLAENFIGNAKGLVYC